jgi:hypothetical protein
MLEIIQVDKDYVRGKIFNWIKLFRTLTNAGLAEAKETFELLRDRGYDVDEVASVINAAGWYEAWLEALGGDGAAYLLSIRKARRLLEQGFTVGPIEAAMTSMDLNVPDLD